MPPTEARVREIAAGEDCTCWLGDECLHNEHRALARQVLALTEERDKWKAWYGDCHEALAACQAEGSGAIRVLTERNAALVADAKYLLELVNNATVATQGHAPTTWDGMTYYLRLPLKVQHKLGDIRARLAALTGGA